MHRRHLYGTVIHDNSAPALLVNPGASIHPQLRRLEHSRTLQRQSLHLNRGVHDSPGAGPLCGLQAAESELNGRLQAGQAGVHAALCDNIDTARALIQLSELVTAVNKYLARRPLPHGAPPDGAPAHHQHRAPPRA